MDTIAKKIQKEAKRNKVSVEDLANAVSSVQYGRKSQHFTAAEYDSMINEDTPTLWSVAEKIADFIEEQ